MLQSSKLPLRVYLMKKYNKENIWMLRQNVIELSRILLRKILEI
jgi:hypothetical protein